MKANNNLTLYYLSGQLIASSKMMLSLILVHIRQFK